MLRILLSVAGQPDPVINERLLCSGCKLRKSSSLKRLVHRGQKPLVGTEILPFKMIEPLSEGLGDLDSAICRGIKW